MANHRFKKVPIVDFVKVLAETQWDIKFGGEIIKKEKKPFTASSKKLTMQRTLDCIESYLTSEDILVADIGDSLFGSTNMTVEKDGYLACSYFANMGFSIPAAIALKFAEKQKRAIALTGDGAFQMTCNELSTAGRYHIPLTVLLLNNQGYGTERMMIDGAFNDIHNWEYHLFPNLVRAGEGVKVSTEDELIDALKKAFLKKEGVFLIEILLGKTDFSDTLKRLSTVVPF